MKQFTCQIYSLASYGSCMDSFLWLHLEVLHFTSLLLHMTFIQINTNYANPDFQFEDSHQCRFSVLHRTPGGNSCVESAPLSYRQMRTTVATEHIMLLLWLRCLLTASCSELNKLLQVQLEQSMTAHAKWINRLSCYKQDLNLLDGMDKIHCSTHAA